MILSPLSVLAPVLAAIRMYALRLRFEHFSAPGPPTGDFLSTNAVTVAPSSGWQSVFFPIGPADLTSIGTDDFVTTMSDVGVVRLLHAPKPVLPPPMIDAVLGVDNITAVPEPGIISLLIFSGALVAPLRRRRRACVSL